MSKAPSSQTQRLQFEKKGVAKACHLKKKKSGLKYLFVTSVPEARTRERTGSQGFAGCPAICQSSKLQKGSLREPCLKKIT